MSERSVIIIFREKKENIHEGKGNQKKVRLSTQNDFFEQRGSFSGFGHPKYNKQRTFLAASNFQTGITA